MLCYVNECGTFLLTKQITAWTQTMLEKLIEHWTG